MKIGTVFSGIGAFEQAVKKLNIEHEIIFACDIDKYVKQSYMANYETKYWFDDIKSINKDSVNEEIDIFVGGSPCQSFSVAGKRLGFEDTRGTLFFEYARCIKELQPKMFIYENVKGLLSHDGGRTWETIKNVFDDLGYKYSYQVLNAKDYGIPQNRQRIFVVGFKDDVDFKFPQKQELKLKVKDLLETAIAPKYYYQKDYGIQNNNINTIRKRNSIEAGDNREHKNGLCPTLTASMGMGGNNVPVINEKYFLSDTIMNGITARGTNTFNDDSVYSNRYDEPLRENKDGISHTLRASLSSVPIIQDKYFLSDKMAEFVLRPHTFNKNPTIDTDIAKTLVATMGKGQRASQANYVTTNSKLRKLTPRECLRLMGFPDDFKQVVSDSQMYKQAGNSIVVNVLEAILKEIKK